MTKFETRYPGKGAAINLIVILLLGLVMFADHVASQDFINVMNRRLQEDEDGDGVLDGADQDDVDDNATTPTASSASQQQAASTTPGVTHRSSANVAKLSLSEFEIQDLQARYKRGEYELAIQSIQPKGGPLYGQTRVMVRMDNLPPFVDAYPHPKCKFGKNKNIVDALYIKCNKKDSGFYDPETINGNSVCIQCEAAPPNDVAEIISFTVSLSGNFDDAYSSAPYRYYNPLHVHSIGPKLGPRDGDSIVEVWGENFIDFGDDFRCNFGTVSTKAHIKNQNYLWCRSPKSTVTGRSMPFSVTLNRQQSSLEQHSFYFYSMQSLFKVDPDYGSVRKDTLLTLTGANFMPWDPDAPGELNFRPLAFCAFGVYGKRQAQLINANTAQCMAPANTQKLTSVPVKLTINNQNYTDEEFDFQFFDPPAVIEMQPEMGPAEGGNLVEVRGLNFVSGKNISCMFGKLNTTGIFKSKTSIGCIVPKNPDPNQPDVKVKIAYDGDKISSEPLIYHYYASPEVHQVASVFPKLGSPNVIEQQLAQLSGTTYVCGPIEGYTQFQIIGKNFKEEGFGQAKCVFNNTIWMNATVVDKTTIICDSPPLESQTGEMWYYIGLSLDGNYVANSTLKFQYYRQLQIHSITPGIGPLEGKTESIIIGKGFQQSSVCLLTVRYEQNEVPFTLINDTHIKVLSPPAAKSGSVVISASGNGQQYVNDITLHFRDSENTFEYYQAFMVEQVTPEAISTEGGSQVRIRAMNFDQFKTDNGSIREQIIYCQFIEDLDSEIKLIGQPIAMKKTSNTEQICLSPKTDFTGITKIQLSVNQQQWHTISSKIKIYNGPKVTAVSPTFGVTKNPKNLKLTVIGENLDCPNNDCSKVKVKFTNHDGEVIIVDGTKVEKNIQCVIPAYPAPETLKVDVSLNGIEWTNSDVSYGFMDPYVLQIRPRLYSPQSKNTATLKGYGFVKREESQMQVSFTGDNNAIIDCKAEADQMGCTETYNVIDENTLTVKVFDKSTAKVGGSPYNGESFYINVKDMDNEFSGNGIQLWFYKDVELKEINSLFAYANEEKPFIIGTDFKWNNGNELNIFEKYATFTCRFTGSGPQPVSVVTEAVMERSPIGAYQPNELPNQIRCRIPKWNSTDKVKLEVSVNGLDYTGNYQLSIVDPLKNFKLSPMAGPIQGGTKLKLYGSGYGAAIPKETQVYIRFGQGYSLQLDKSLNSDEKWNSDAFYKELNIPNMMLLEAETNDLLLKDESLLTVNFGALTPDVSTLFAIGDYEATHAGGQVYVQLSERIAVNATDHRQRQGTLKVEGQEYLEYIETTFQDSSNLEFYFYRNPFVTKIEPLSGLVNGGTKIAITGGWFQQEPQYGVYPFCKIGDQISLGKFITTNRIICTTPPSLDTVNPQVISVSLNGVDFVQTKYTFSYYDKPILNDIQPRSGRAEGGTEIWLRGQKFSKPNEENSKLVRCRFRQVNYKNEDDEDLPTKFVPAVWIDKETMKCGSPAGWSGGDTVKVDLTFNGVDFTDNSFEFTLFSVFQSFPKSGPSDATNQVIQVKGKGFKQNFAILCALNGTEVAPVKVKSDVIQCPMVLPGWPSTAYETVPFYVMIDGVKTDLGLFHYYKQVEVANVNPLIGPNEGLANIYISGKYFRADFENAKPACRIGNILSKAQIIDSETVRCVLDKKLPLLDEGQSMPVSFALNSYSWARSDFTFQTYGLLNIYPTSGPVDDNTNINVIGKGFQNDLVENARCKFGTDDNYQIVEAQVLDDERLICKSPSESFVLPDAASQEISVPFSIAFQEDMYYPFTQSVHKFRLYNQPETIDIDPFQASVQKLTEVYVYASEENSFRQPIPASGSNQVDTDQYGPKCKFGRFGTSPATYINSTTILCLTPNIQDDPADIGEESVIVTVAMNGVDFNDELTKIQFTFVGTGGNLSIWVIIMATLVLSLLILSIMLFISGLNSWMNARRRQDLQSYTEPNQMGLIQPRSSSRARGDSLSRGNRQSSALNQQQLAISRMRSRANQSASQARSRQNNPSR